MIVFTGLYTVGPIHIALKYQYAASVEVKLKGILVDPFDIFAGSDTLILYVPVVNCPLVKHNACALYLSTIPVCPGNSIPNWSDLDAHVCATTS